MGLKEYDPLANAEPVDYDPFAATQGSSLAYEPVDYDPFVSKPKRSSGATRSFELPEPTGLVEAASKGVVSGLQQIEESGGTALEYLGGRLNSKTLQDVGKTYKEKWKPEEAPLDLQGSIVEQPELLKNPSWWVYNIAQAGVSMLPGMVTGVGAGVALTGLATKAPKAISILGKAYELTPKLIERLVTAGAATVGGAVGGAQEGTSTYNEVIERGGTEQEAARAMEAMTTASGLLNTLSFGQILKPGKLLSLKRFLATGGTESLTEYLEEPWEVIIKRAILPDEKFTKQEAVKQLLDGINVVPAAFITGGVAGAAGGASQRTQMRKYAGALKEATNSGDHVKLTDDALESITEVATKVAQERPWDKKLAASVDTLRTEALNRRSSQPQTGVPETSPLGTPSAETATGTPAPSILNQPAPDINRERTGLSPEFFRDVKSALETGVDNDGQSFTMDDAKGIYEAYRDQPDADPVSVKVFENLLGTPLGEPAATVQGPTPGQPSAAIPSPEQSLAGFRTFLEQGPDTDAITALKNDVLEKHRDHPAFIQLTDDLHKAIVDHEASKPLTTPPAPLPVADVITPLASAPGGLLETPVASVFSRMPDAQLQTMADQGVNGAKVEVARRSAETSIKAVEIPSALPVAETSPEVKAETAPAPIVQPGATSGGKFRTGEPVSLGFIHNTEKAPNMGARFGQDLEPAGRYIQERPRTFKGEDFPNMEEGTTTFNSPLVLEWGGGYQEATNWKRVLSDQYNGKTGKKLSDAIRKDGHDGIITLDKYGNASEIVDLKSPSPLPEAGAKGEIVQPGATSGGKQPWEMTAAEYKKMAEKVKTPVVAPEPVSKQPHEMTRAEFRHAENAPKVEAIQNAIRQGKRIVVATYTKGTRLTNPEHIRIASDGSAQIPSGRKWLNLTDDALNNVANQAGVPIVPFADRVYHNAIVEQAIKDGKFVPPEVLAEYPKLKSIRPKKISPVAPARTPRSKNPLAAVAAQIKKNGRLALGAKRTATQAAHGFLADYSKEDAKVLNKMYPTLLSSRGTQNLDEIAESFGYNDGDELFQALMYPDRPVVRKGVEPEESELNRLAAQNANEVLEAERENERVRAELAALEAKDPEINAGAVQASRQEIGADILGQVEAQGTIHPEAETELNDFFSEIAAQNQAAATPIPENKPTAKAEVQSKDWTDMEVKKGDTFNVVGPEGKPLILLRITETDPFKRFHKVEISGILDQKPTGRDREIADYFLGREQGGEITLVTADLNHLRQTENPTAKDFKGKNETVKSDVKGMNDFNLVNPETEISRGLKTHEKGQETAGMFEEPKAEAKAEGQDMARWEMDFGIMGKYTFRPINRVPVPDGGRLVSSAIHPYDPKFSITKRLADEHSIPRDYHAFRVSVIENKDGERYAYVEYMGDNGPNTEGIIDAQFNKLNSDALENRDFDRINRLAEKAWEQANKKEEPSLFEAEPEPKAEPTSNTEDAGEELTYNKRNRITTGIKWGDIADKNTALKVKETTKQNVYPRPDYQAMIDGGMNPMVAHLVKQVYDSMASKPATSQAPTDADLKLYIDAMNRVMEGTISWANNNESVARWAEKQARFAGAALGRPTSITSMATSVQGLLDTVYPGGWKNFQAEVHILGGNKALRALQPGYDEGARASKALNAGWPVAQESWQKQGYSVTESVKTLAVQKGKNYDSVEAVKPDTFRIMVNNARWVEGNYETATEAEAAIKAYKPWLLLKGSGRIEGQFDTEAEATDAAREAVKRESKTKISDKGISVESAERIGPARRLEGEDITSDRLKETFGFKGVNFGNWMKGESNQAERQLHLNHAYDAFMDLAEILNVPPKAMSLNGFLGIAIGAQGTGAHAAHFVPGVNEINLTRTSGAGALAHEFGHGLDHYFATQAGIANREAPYLSEAVDGPIDAEGYTKREGKKVKVFSEDIRPEIVGLYKTLDRAMNKKPAAPVDIAAQIQTSKEKSQKNVEGWLRSIRGDYKGIEDAFDKLADRIKSLDLGEGKVSIGSSSYVSPVVSELRDLYKKQNGRVYNLDNITALQANIDHLAYLNSKKAAERNHIPQETATDYARESDKADKGKGGKKYWSTKREKFARAFDAFVTDTLKEQAAKNSYLSGIEAIPPLGAERTAINKAFDGLVKEIKTRETDKGVEMYSVVEREAIGRDSAAFSDQLDDFAAGKLVNRLEPITIGHTPIVLEKLGAEQLPLVITQRVVEKAISTEGYAHGISAETLKQLPAQLADPVMVFDSATEADSLVVMTELKQDGKSIVAAIRLSKEMGRNVVNDIVSVRPRTSEYHFINWIDQGLLRYMNRSKSRAWSVTSGLQLPTVRGSKPGFKNKILFDSDLVKENYAASPDDTIMPTLSDVQDAFKDKNGKPVAEVIQPGGGDSPIYITMRDGRSLTVEAVNYISPNEVDFRIAYARTYNPKKDIITGSFGDGVVMLVRGKAGQWTLAHELRGHGYRALGIINDSDAAILRGHIKGEVRAGNIKTANKEDTGGEEDIANFIADIQTGKKQQPKGSVGRVIARIREFLDRLVNAFGKRTAGGIAREVKSGEIFDRGLTEAQRRGTNYSVTSEKGTANIPPETTPKAVGGIIEGGLPEGTVLKVRIPNSSLAGGGVEGYLGPDGKVLVDGNWYSPNDIAYWGMPRYPEKTKLYNYPHEDVIASFKKNEGNPEQIQKIYDAMWKVDRNIPYDGSANSERYRNVPQNYKLQVRNLEGEGIILPSKKQIEDYTLDKSLKSYHEFNFGPGSYLHLTTEPRQLSPNEAKALEAWEQSGGGLGRTALVSLERGKESRAWGYESPEGPEKKIKSVPNPSRPPAGTLAPPETTPEAEAGRYYAGTSEGKPTGKYTYLTTNPEYAKNFGSDVRRFAASPENTLDLTSHGEKAISFEHLQVILKKEGVEITESMREKYDDVYKPVWQWSRKYPDMADAIKKAGYDSIKQIETFTGKGKKETTLVILDRSKVKLLPNPSHPPEGGGRFHYSVQTILSNKEGYKKAVPSTETPQKDWSVEKVKVWIQNEKDLYVEAALYKLAPNDHKMSMFKKIITSPEYYKHPVAARIVRLFQRDREEIFHETIGHLNNLDRPDLKENTVTELGKKLKDKGMSLKQRTLGESSKEYQDLEKIIDEADKDGVVYTEANLKKQDFSDDTISVWRAMRDSYDRELDLKLKPMQEMIDQIEKEAERKGVSPVDYSPIYQSLKGALAQMGQLKGSYAPRIREGNWAVRARRPQTEARPGEYEYTRPHKESRMSADRLSRKLRSEGWEIQEWGVTDHTGTVLSRHYSKNEAQRIADMADRLSVTHVNPAFEVSKLPEDVYQDLKTVSVAKAIEAALDGMTKKGTDLFGVGTKDQTLKFNEELLRTVAEEIKARGARSSEIRRTKDIVVSGYMTDPLERHFININRTARGYAKARVAMAASNELLGKYYKGHRLGGINAKADPEVFSTMKDYVNEQLRNLDKIDRLIGWAKSLATLKFMGLSGRAAIVNMTAMGTTAPATMHGELKKHGSPTGFIKIARELGKAGKDTIRVMVGKNLLNVEEQRFITDVKKKGWDDAQYAREMEGMIGKIQTQTWNRIMDVAMKMFSTTEKWNRISTMLATFRLAKGTYEERAEIAKLVSDGAHGSYGRATNPSLLWGSNPGAKFAQLFYVYLKFPHNYLQRVHRLGFEERDWRAFAYALISPMVISGLAALPFKDQWMWLLGMLATLFGLKERDEDLEKKIWDIARYYLGEGAEIAGRYGFLGALGVDVSGSLSIGAGFPKDRYEAFGAVGGAFKEGVNAIGQLRKGSPGRAMEHILPSGLANVARAYREANEGITTGRKNPVYDEKGRPLYPSSIETALRVGGFRSSRQATLQERMYAAKQQAVKFEDRKKDIKERFKGYLSQPESKRDPTDHKEIRLMVREFNTSVRAAKLKGQVPEIDIRAMRDQIAKLRQATRKEKAMMR